VVIQPKTPRRTRLPILIEAKSARFHERKTSAAKKRPRKCTSSGTPMGRILNPLVLCGYFDSGYWDIGGGRYDWVWSIASEDLDKLGLIPGRLERPRIAQQSEQHRLEVLLVNKREEPAWAICNPSVIALE